MSGFGTAAIPGQDFVTSTAYAHSQLASNLGNQHRTDKTQTNTTTAAPASTPVAADQPAASTTTELTTVSS